MYGMLGCGVGCGTPPWNVALYDSVKLDGLTPGPHTSAVTSISHGRTALPSHQPSRPYCGISGERGCGDGRGYVCI